MVDLHTHVIPAVDDGAESPDVSTSALARLRDHGVDAVIATPHFDASATLQPGRRAAGLELLDTGWEILKSLVSEHAPGLRVERGAEIKLDTPRPDLTDPRLRLAGGAFVLVEFAGMTPPPSLTQVLDSFAEAGLTPVLAHPERYAMRTTLNEMVDVWHASGGYLQVNCGSLLGKYGERAQRTSSWLLQEGLAGYLASDFHSRGEPSIRACSELLETWDATEQRDLLLSVNPGRLLEGLPPLQVPGIEMKTKRKFRFF